MSQTLNGQPFLKPTGSRLKFVFIIASVAGVSSVTSAILVSKSLSSQKTEQNSSLYTLDSINSEIGVAALGRLSPKGEVIHLSAPAFVEGARVEQLLIKPGDRVKSGQVVAVLDSRDRLKAALERSRKQMKVAQAHLMQVKAGAKRGEISAQTANIQQLEAELAGQIAAQTATVTSLNTELQNAQTECDRYEYLYQDGAISASERDNKCLIPKKFQQQLQAARVNLNRTKQTLRQQLTEAKATLEQIAEVRPTDIAFAQAQIEEAQAAVAQAQSNLNLAYVRSPQSGQILKIHTFPGEIISNRGIADIGQTQQMYAIAEVYETDINKVHLGQKATITSIGFSGELRGIVDEIGLQIGKKDVLSTDPAADVDSRVVEVKIRLNPINSQRVTGLTNLKVNVVIDTSDSIINPEKRD